MMMMTKAERQALKAQRRQQVIAKKQQSSEPPPPPPPPPSSSSSYPSGRAPVQMQIDDPKSRSKIKKGRILCRRIPAQKPVPLFSHLSQFETNVFNLTVSTIHPSVRTLGLLFSEFMIAGGNARAVAMLTTFKELIYEYHTPPGNSLQRHLTSYINKQVDFLANVRVLAFSMRTAQTFLKSEISHLPIDLPDTDAKRYLCERIDVFIRDRIVVADESIVQLGLSKIYDGDVIMTYARSSSVIQLLTVAHRKGIKFRVIVVDSRPKLEGKNTLQCLMHENIKCTYVILNSISNMMNEVTKVIMGASAVLSNGAVMSRVGTAVVAMCAYDARVPVIIACETYKFSDDVRVDSFVWNEIGDPDELVDTDNQRGPLKKLPSFLPSSSSSSSSKNKRLLADWRNVDALKLLNLHYDVTPAKFITVVLSDTGLIATSSVPTFLSIIGANSIY